MNQEQVSISNEVSKSDFWKKMEELEREIARFQTAVDEFCEAKKEFIVLLPEVKGWDYV